MLKIVPAILTPDFESFKQQLAKLEGLFDTVQIDIMDGQFVPNKSFEEIEEINGLKTKVSFELHLMVENPLTEMAKWTEIKNVRRVIFHLEAGDPGPAINFARGYCWQVGLALNPETPLTKAEPYYKLVNEILFMTVHPGRQGAKFLPEVGEKIKTLADLKERPLIAVDGGINEKNIAEVKSWGAEIFCIGSALTMAEDVKKTYQELSKLLKE